MVTFEPLASYDEVVKSELMNHTFSNEQEIVDAINTLVFKGILKIRIGSLRNNEIKYLLKFGDIRSSDKRSLSFDGMRFNEEIVSLRSKLNQQFFYPK